MTEPATNPTEPTPVAPEPAPAAAVPAVDDGKPQPAASSVEPLLGGDPTPAEGDPKPADAKPADPVKSEGAPEKYEFVAPEGREFDPKMLESFSAVAKEAGWTQDVAQKHLDKLSADLAAHQAEEVTAVHRKWREDSIADKEFGGDKLNENLGIAKKALDTFFPELLPFLKESGLSNYPDMIRGMVRVGKAISEDKFVGGNRSTEQRPEAVFYPTMTQK